MRHEVSLASAEHSMMFFSGRLSILARAAATTSASAAAAGQVGHCGQVTTPAWGTGSGLGLGEGVGEGLVLGLGLGLGLGLRLGLRLGLGSALEVITPWARGTAVLPGS